MLKKFKSFLYRNSKSNISNISVNWVLSPVYAAIVFVIFRRFGIPVWSKHVESIYYINRSAIHLTLFSTWFYCYCSTFFQPDLDVAEKRPGMSSFPVGTYFATKISLDPLVKLLVYINFFSAFPGRISDPLYKFLTNKSIRYFPGNILKRLFWPVTKAWYWYWHPFAYLFTHRGAVHWPVIGVWLRVLWLMPAIYLMDFIFFQLHMYPLWFSAIKLWTKMFFPWHKDFGSVWFYAFCLPVYLTDIFHSAVDWIESKHKDLPFCSCPPARRGLISATFLRIKNLKRTILSQAKKMS